MSREHVEMRIVGSLSKNNSTDDLEDEEDWEDLRSRIEALCKESRYFTLGVMVV